MKKGQSRCFTTDRTLVLGGQARLVRHGNEILVSVMRPDTGPLIDWTLEGSVQLELM